MSFIHKKLRLFEPDKNPEFHEPRSAGRMKTYQSATDVRSWCNAPHDRRQYILDLVKGDNEKTPSTKKCKPLIGTLINILLSNKNADAGGGRRLKFKDLTKIQDLNPCPEGLSKLCQKSSKKPDLPVTQTARRRTRSDTGSENNTDKNRTLREITSHLSRMSCRSDRPGRWEDYRRSDRANRLKEKIRELENEKQVLLNKIKDCELNMYSQKKRISKLANNVEYLTRYQHLQTGGQKVARSTKNDVQPTMSQPLFKQKKQALLNMKAQTEVELDRKIKQASRASFQKTMESSKRRDKIDMMQSTGDHFRSKLELEKQRCNDIVNRYTNTITNMKFEIDIVEKASGNFLRNKHRFLSDHARKSY